MKDKWNQFLRGEFLKIEKKIIFFRGEKHTTKHTKKYNKMEEYLLETCDATLNQRFDENLAKYWEEEEFWQKLVETYFPDEELVGESWIEFGDKLINETFKKVKVLENRKHVGDIYVSDENTHKETREYALNQIDKSLEEIQEHKIWTIKSNFDNYVGWTGSNKASISITYADSVSPKKSPKLTEEDYPRKSLSESKWKAKFREEFGNKYKLEEAESWADIYEVFKVAKTPIKTLDVGAMVDAIPRSAKNESVDNEHYGYITRIARNTKETPVELTIRVFETLEDQIWIRHGSGAKASWLPKDEYEKVKEEGGTIRELFYKDLVVNPKVLKFKN